MDELFALLSLHGLPAEGGTHVTATINMALVMEDRTVRLGLASINIAL